MSFKRDPEGSRSRSRAFPPLDMIIFDMDGVLIDVTGSYRKAIQKTVQVYLESCLGFRIGKKGPVKEEYISFFKSLGNFNNDWDLTSGLLLSLLSVSPLPPSSRLKKFSTIEETVSHLRRMAGPYAHFQPPRFRGKYLHAMAKRIKSFGGGLKGVRKAIGAMGDSWDGWVYRTGYLDSENLVKRIFQEVYLGKAFSSLYGLKPLFYKGEGFYLREKPLIPRPILSSLHKKAKLAIASGRPQFEARLALIRFRLLPFFESVVTLEDCEKEEARLFRLHRRKTKLSKPHPYPILRAIHEAGPGYVGHRRCGYIGDVVDDMTAALAAKENFDILAIGFVDPSGHKRTARESLLKAGAELIIEDPKDLLRLVE
jgi:phosphoglycolate phosphatase-like HAD superfamily hydrolase